MTMGKGLGGLILGFGSTPGRPKRDTADQIRQQQKYWEAEAKARKTVGAWIYLKKPTEAVKRALELLSTPQYPDGRTHQYDPAENDAAMESGEIIASHELRQTCSFVVSM